MRANIRCLFLICLLLEWTVPGHAQDIARNPDFTREVRPILARYCFKCHGPDEKTRKAKLRLDVAGKAADGVIVSGKPEASELLTRIFAKDPDTRMPPPSTKTELSAVQKKILQRWI